MTKSMLSLLLFTLVVFVSPVKGSEPPELEIDHVMFVVYHNPSLLDRVFQQWQQYGKEKIFKGEANRSYRAIYHKNSSFYVEYLSTSAQEPYWSNAVYVVLEKKYWDYYKEPAFVSEHFLIPFFGCGYQLVSPDYPHLNSAVSGELAADALTLLISRALAEELTNLAGGKYRLPDDGQVRVDERLFHLHDMAVVTREGKLIAPLFEANPLLRDNL